MKGPFAQVHRGLIRNGYSPVPLLPRTKRPWLNDWRARLSSAPITIEEAAKVTAAYPMAGIGVAGGFNGLAPIDVDAEAPEIVDRITEILPAPIVAKAGQKGWTAFYRGQVEACKLKDADGRTMVEVLVSGQTVIPPSIHPDTGRQYRWLTRSTLLDTRVSDLPEISEAVISELREALAPFMRSRQVWETVSIDASPEPTSGRLEAYARAVLSSEASELAGVLKGGRHLAAIRAGCVMGKWVHHGHIGQGTVEAALMAACQSNGLRQEDGDKSVLVAIQFGIGKASNDAMPAIADRPMPIKGRWAQYAEMIR
jgi:hypothetical protein